MGEPPTTEDDARAPRLRVYLAGPEVFFPNAVAHGEEKKRIAAELGFEGLFPLDNVIDNAAALAPSDLARAISRANEEMIRRADLLVANCTPFRGPSMDVGTAYEIGFARALGKPVFGYSNAPDDYASRVRATPPHAVAAWCAETRAADIEDFGLGENLMIAVAALETGGRLLTGGAAADRMLSDLAAFRDCLAFARARLGAA